MGSGRSCLPCPVSASPYGLVVVMVEGSASKVRFSVVLTFSDVPDHTMKLKTIGLGCVIVMGGNETPRPWAIGDFDSTE